MQDPDHINALVVLTSCRGVTQVLLMQSIIIPDFFSQQPFRTGFSSEGRALPTSWPSCLNVLFTSFLHHFWVWQGANYA